jgi:hypothetical protein
VASQPFLLPLLAAAAVRLLSKAVPPRLVHLARSASAAVTAPLAQQATSWSTLGKAAVLELAVVLFLL